MWAIYPNLLSTMWFSDVSELIHFPLKACLALLNSGKVQQDTAVWIEESEWSSGSRGEIALWTKDQWNKIMSLGAKSAGMQRGPFMEMSRTMKARNIQWWKMLHLYLIAVNVWVTECRVQAERSLAQIISRIITLGDLKLTDTGMLASHSLPLND